MKRWTKETAENFARKYIVAGKGILLDGTATLGLCSAFDYLVNQHGYFLCERR